MNNDDKYLLSNFDPYEHAYCQPALRASPFAKPEQPFPPGKLGKDDVLPGDGRRSLFKLLYFNNNIHNIQFPNAT